MAVGFAAALVLLALGALFVVYRRWHLHWGADQAEIASQLPGDEIVGDPAFNATRGLSVGAAPSEIWPWIVQIGFGRAGWYSYDLLDNFGRHSSDRILPSLQDVRPGDSVPMGPGGAGMKVKTFEAPRWMLWWDGKGDATWLWSLEEVAPHQTRLLTRVRIRYRWLNPAMLMNLLVIEPWDFPMMRKCMFGIKRRAERMKLTSPKVAG